MTPSRPPAPHPSCAASGTGKSRRFKSGRHLTPKRMVRAVTRVAGDWRYDAVALGYHRRAARSRGGAGGGVWWSDVDYAALAVDYDGTLALDGNVDAATIAALDRARAAGLTLLLVTGRELADLFTAFPHSSLFDRIVAENGAVLYTPATDAVRLLAAPPPPSLLERLEREAVPFSVGHTIVATVEPHEYAVLEAIHDLGLEWHVIFNKGAVMALPADITKATGLRVALKELGIMRERIVGVGDAENDQAFLRMCGLSVAVANALPTVKAGADIVTRGERGTGVIEVIEGLLAGELGAARRRAT